MKLYRCDNCNEERPSIEVILKGVGGFSGLLLPDRLQEKHFCDPKCFWEWAIKNCPETKTITFPAVEG